MFLWIFLLSFILCFPFSIPQDPPPVTLLKQEFKKIEVALNAKELSDLLKVKAFALNSANAESLLKKSKEDTEKIVKKTANIVNNLRVKVTQLFENKVNQSNVSESECPNANYTYYFRAKALKNGTELKDTCKDQQLPMTLDDTVDNVPTNRNSSTVHIPTNVYYAAKEIQQVAQITEGMDEFFKSNNDVEWQYFCSNTGFFRIFPGVIWHIQVIDYENVNTKVDFFDCRSEQWYLESTSYPKKMVIVVDKSGSMKGRRRIIANHTINEILNTLTENDYFNIILFNKTYMYADNVTRDILIEGTAKNKKFIMDKLAHNFEPGGIAEYDVGIKRSLELLNNNKGKAQDDFYNYMIMIVSDGSPFDYQNVVKEFNKVNARIFTYLIGQGITEGDPVKQMACNNNGYAVEIATLADVKENVQKYLNVVARTNAKEGVYYKVWTGVQENQIKTKEPDSETSDSNLEASAAAASEELNYPMEMNSLNTKYALNITSDVVSNATAEVTVPVVTKISVKKEKPIKMFVSCAEAIYAEKKLSGAVGIDVPIKDFLNTAPFWKLGVGSYLFGVTNNGFVVFHPRFRPQYKDFIKYFFRNVDISEVEHNITEKTNIIPNTQVLDTELRRKIMDFKDWNAVKNIGQNEVYEIIDDFHTALPIKREYFITRIKDTSYKFGLAVLLNQNVLQYIRPTATNKDIAKLIDLSLDATKEGMTLTYFEYCKNFKKILLENPLKLMKKVLDEGTKCEPSNDEYVEGVAGEIFYTNQYVQKWKNINISYIEQIFSMHHFGLTRYYNFKELSFKNFIDIHDQGLNDPLYKETVLNVLNSGQTELMTATPLANKDVKKGILPKDLVFTVTVPLYNKVEKVYSGIVGVQVNYNLFENLLKTTICNNTNEYDCYLITKSSLIIYNNKDIRFTGKMLKDVDCKLMESLVEANIYKKQNLYDFQGLCPDQKVYIDSFSNRLFDPFSRLFNLVTWIIYEFIILLQNVSLSSLFWSYTAQEENPIYKVPSPFSGFYCGINFDRFTSLLTSTSNGNLTCPKCTKTWEIFGIDNTNLLFVIVKKQNSGCSCDCSGSFGIQSSVKRDKTKSIKNPSVMEPYYHQNLKKNPPNDKNEKCKDGATMIKYSTVLILLSTSVIFIFH